MSNLARMASFAGITLAGGLVFANPPAKTVKEIMVKLNKGANAPLFTLKRDLQKDNPGWPDIQSQAKEYSTLAAELKDSKPLKGDMASWAKLVKDYGETAKALNDAAQKKDKSAALAAHSKLMKACAACHKAHRD